MDNIYVVYELLRPYDIGRVAYVGIGSPSRPREHYADAKKGKHRNPILQSIFDKAKRLGFDDLPVRIVASNLSWDEAALKERELIKLHGRISIGTGCLANLTDGGDGVLGMTHSEETKRIVGDKSLVMWSDPERRIKIIEAQNAGKTGEEFHRKRSAASSKIWADPELRAKSSETKKQRYVADPDLRALVSERTKLAMARPDVAARQQAAQKKRFEDPEQRDHLRFLNVGKTISEETRKKIGDAHRGQKRSPESRAKMSAWQIGRQMSDDAKENMRKAARNRPPISAETRGKLREAALRQWAGTREISGV